LPIGNTPESTALSSVPCVNSSPRWGSLVKAAKAPLDHLAAAEEAIKNGKNLEAGLNSLAKLRPLLELVAKQ
jgi:hypothetical protein